MAIIGTEVNLDLKEGKSLYNCPLDTLDMESLAKAYAYALFTWGDSVQSRTVLDAIRDKDRGQEKSALQSETLFTI